MKGIPCASLKESLLKIKSEREKGAWAEIARNAGISAPVISRIASGQQQTVTYEAWDRLHRADSDIPPPSVDAMPSDLELFRVCPELKTIIDEAEKEAKAGYGRRYLLKMLRNHMDTLIEREIGGRDGARKTG